MSPEPPDLYEYVASLEGQRTMSSWRPLDLTDAVNGVGPPPPTVCIRTDGKALFYPGRIHWLQGESESLKSWLAQVAAAQELDAGHTVLWIDFEDDATGVVSRLRALGVAADVILERFVYIRPDDPLQHRGAVMPGQVDLDDVLRQHTYTLVVIDGVTEAMTVEGMSYIDNTDIAIWMRLLPKKVADVTGAAVGCIDHVTKNADTRGRYAIGGQHKLAGVTGATYKVAASAQLSRAETFEVTGKATVSVEKDRPGWVRGHAQSGVVAVLELTSYPDGGVTSKLTPPDQSTNAPPFDMQVRILDFLAAYPGSGKNAIERDVEGKGATLRAAAKWLVDAGLLEIKQVGQTHQHYLTEQGQQMLDNYRSEHA